MGEGSDDFNISRRHDAWNRLHSIMACLHIICSSTWIFQLDINISTISTSINHLDITNQAHPIQHLNITNEALLSTYASRPQTLLAT